MAPLSGARRRRLALMPVRRGLAALCVVTAALAGTMLGVPTAQAQPSFTLRTADGAVARIGAFHPSRSPKLAAAIRVFGKPTSRKLTSENSCQVDWRKLRLRIVFANFGARGHRQTTCTSSVGRAQTFTARGSRFRTVRGLRPGASSKSIPTRHPNAEFRQGSWWLVTAVSPFGDESEYPVIRAIVGGGRVRALAGFIGAAGE